MVTEFLLFLVLYRVRYTFLMENILHLLFAEK